MEILPGIHHLKQDMAPVFAGTWTVVSVVVGERLAVVDTGTPDSAAGLILPCLQRIGRRPAEIAAIVVTHGHGDHFGSNEELKRLSGAPIMVHHADAASLDRAGRWREREFRPGPADVLLREGDVVDLGSRRLEVVELPGHTPGSIGLLDRADGVLFTGDALQALGTDVQHLAFYNDPDAYVASLEKALRLDVAHLVPAHAYRPFVESHVHGPDVRRYLEVSLEFALGLDAQILADLQAAGAPQSAAAVADRICARAGTGGTTGMATATVAAHLRRLAARGEVGASGGGAEPTYTL